jgi:hypothetical protein
MNQNVKSLILAQNLTRFDFFERESRDRDLIISGLAKTIFFLPTSLSTNQKQAFLFSS